MAPKKIKSSSTLFPPAESAAAPAAAATSDMMEAAAEPCEGGVSEGHEDTVAAEPGDDASAQPVIVEGKHEDVKVAGGGTIPRQLESMQSAFKMCVPKKPTAAAAGDGAAGDGATFYAILPVNVPRTESDFGEKDFMYLTPYLAQPVAPGRAAAPHEYARSSKKSKEVLMAFNKSGLPLTAWGDSSHSEIRFWGFEKKGFNRGNRLDDMTWTYGGGHNMAMAVNQKDLVPREGDGCIPFFYYAPMPDTDAMLAFDVVKVTLMPKNDEMLRKEHKTCFGLKTVTPTVRTLASLLSHLRQTMHKSKEDAEADMLRLLRGEGKYKDTKKGSNGGLLPYAHQIDAMPPMEDRENYAMAEVTSCSFLQENLGGDTTFMYDADSSVVRMCIKPTGCHPYMIDMPRAAVLKNANAKDIHSACGLYTLAANCPGALSAFVTHNRFWSNKLWDPDCGYGDATAFRGAPVIDASKLLAPLARDAYYLSNPAVTGQGNKARVMVDLGFKMLHEPDAPAAGDAAAAADDDDAAADAGGGGETETCGVYAEVAVLPRKIAGPSPPASAYRIASDMRISPHGAASLDVAHVMTVYLKTSTGRKNILNLDYNGARDVGCATVVTGRKHGWSNAMPSAIDDGDDDDEDAASPGAASAKRAKVAMDSVA